MTEAVPHDGVEPTLRARGPAYSVIQKCLEVQADAAPRGRVAHFFGRSPLSPDARSWFQGALGEIEVAGVLSRLGPGWTVLHAVPVGSGESDIDHVVIGPPGIFTINTKNHSGHKIFVGGGSLTVDGHRTEHMRNSVHEAQRASKLLSKVAGDPVKVTPLIVLVGVDRLSIGRKRPTVTVLHAEQLQRWLQKRPQVHSDEAVAYFALIAEERGTWHTVAHVTDDTLRHVQRFERLRHEVDVARRRRRWWSLFGTLSMLAVVGLVLVGVLGLAANLFLKAFHLA